MMIDVNTIIGRRAAAAWRGDASSIFEGRRRRFPSLLITFSRVWLMRFWYVDDVPKYFSIDWFFSMRSPMPSRRWWWCRRWLRWWCSRRADVQMMMMCRLPPMMMPPITMCRYIRLRRDDEIFSMPPMGPAWWLIDAAVDVPKMMMMLMAGQHFSTLLISRWFLIFSLMPMASLHFDFFGAGASLFVINIFSFFLRHFRHFSQPPIIFLFHFISSMLIDYLRRADYFDYLDTLRCRWLLRWHYLRMKYRNIFIVRCAVYYWCQPLMMMMMPMMKDIFIIDESEMTLRPMLMRW